MGTYLNPGNGGFQRILKNFYIDKTGMIELINERMDTPDGLVCKPPTPFWQILCCTNVMCIL